MRHDEGASELERTRLEQMRRNTAALNSIRAMNDADLSAATPTAARIEEISTISNATDAAAKAKSVATSMSAAELKITGGSSISAPLTPSPLQAASASGREQIPGEQAKLQAQGQDLLELKGAPAKRSVEDGTQDTCQQSAMTKHARTAVRTT